MKVLLNGLLLALVGSVHCSPMSKINNLAKSPGTWAGSPSISHFISTAWSIWSDSWGSVDFDVLCSTILRSCSASSANFPSAQAKPDRRWNKQNLSQPNPPIWADGPPCMCSIFPLLTLWDDPSCAYSSTVTSKQIIVWCWWEVHFGNVDESSETGSL